jgi:hypothetical protein
LLAGTAILLPAAANPQHSVDGSHAALEIPSRSSYVPSSPIGVDPGPPAMRRNAARSTRLEMPLWMK